MAGKNEIIDAIAERTGLSKREAGSAYESFLEAIAQALRRGERVNVAGLGNFTVADRAARQGRNPKTGEPIQIPASRNVKFKPGKELKELVNTEATS